MARAAIMALDLEGLSDLKVIRESPFVFSAHGSQYRWVFPIHYVVTMFLMLANARMLPVTFFRCLAMFLAAIKDGS